MRNSKVKALIVFLEKNKDSASTKELLASIENKLARLRRAHNEVIDELAISYGSLVYECFRYLVYSGTISSDDISEKGTSNYVYGVTHIDLMLTYVEDFVGGDFMEKGIDEHITKLTSE